MSEIRIYSESDIPVLRQLRDEAWHNFNPKAPASRTNDWCTFAELNANYHQAHRQVYGCPPEMDHVERESSDYWLKTRYANRAAQERTTTPRTDAERDAGNARRRPSRFYSNSTPTNNQATSA